MQYLKPALLILVPLLMGFGQVLKKSWNVSTKFVPWILLACSILLASVYGLVVSDQTGWRFWVDAIVMTGLCHGTVAAFGAMGIFDLVKSARKEAS